MDQEKQPIQRPLMNRRAYSLLMNRVWVPGFLIEANGSALNDLWYTDSEAYAVRVSDSICAHLDTKRNNGAR